MWLTAILPFLLQAAAILFDEGYFHIRRGLPKWERIGHPLDTLSVIASIGYVLWVPFSSATLIGYCALASFSCLLVTKDEFVHKEHCPASENWLHAVLFTLHPVTLAVAGFIWPVARGVQLSPWIMQWLNRPDILRLFLLGQFGLLSLFCLYQVIFWNFVWKDDQQRIL
ncbi:MAG: hypothetical protein JSS32_05120 [Verrucomicrobia bacterium]|nr:hypothetical protein [Verrucomicrobiota bacterium]